MKRVVIGLTVWNVGCPAIALIAQVGVNALGWDSGIGATVGVLSIISASLWLLTTPIVAGLAIYWSKAPAPKQFLWANSGALVVWGFGLLWLVNQSYL